MRREPAPKTTDSRVQRLAWESRDLHLPLVWGKNRRLTRAVDPCYVSCSTVSRSAYERPVESAV